MTEPECTCTELERGTVCHDMRNEPHVIGCPRWGAPLHDEAAARQWAIEAEAARCEPLADPL